MNAAFGKILNNLVAAVFALVFFTGFIAAGLVMRLFSKSCRMNIDRSAPTYWRVIPAADKDK